KASSRKPALALPKPFRSSTGKAKSGRAVSAPEAAGTSQQGLLQLSFARHAHGYGFVGAAAFLLDAILILYIGIQSPVLPTGVRLDFLVWLLPSVAGAVASWDAVRLKREPYRRPYESTQCAIDGVRRLAPSHHRLVDLRLPAGDPEGGQLEGRADPAGLPEEAGSARLQGARAPRPGSPP